jgi:hypothetical protein
MTNGTATQDRQPDDGKGQDKERYQIQIDRVHYTVEQDALTGAELRALADPQIGPERDLFEVVPGGTDRKIPLSNWPTEGQFRQRKFAKRISAAIGSVAASNNQDIER